MCDDSFDKDDEGEEEGEEENDDGDDVFGEVKKNVCFL